MGTVLWTISKAAQRRSWPRTWFCLQGLQHPLPPVSQAQVTQLTQGELWGLARHIFQLSRQESWGSRRESHLQHPGNSGTTPGPASCPGGEAKLLSSSPPHSLTHPTVKEESSPGKMQREHEQNEMQNQSQKTKNEQLAGTETKIIIIKKSIILPSSALEEAGL